MPITVSLKKFKQNYLHKNVCILPMQDNILYKDQRYLQAQFDLVTSKTTASTRQIDFYVFSRDTEVGHPI